MRRRRGWQVRLILLNNHPNSKDMRIIKISVIAMVLSLASAVANLPEDPAAYADWEAGMLKSIQQLSTTWNEKTIASLGRTVGQLSEEKSPNWEKGERPVFRAAQAALLAIPGHAEFYRDRINEARRKLDAEPAESVECGPLQNALYNEQMYGFQTLAQLPSAETVRVLGEFLFDDHGILPGDGEQAWLERPNSRCAANALSKLPLVARPVTAKESGSEDVPTWRLWYQQVKAGTRTIRFVGDPKEYNLRDLMRQPATPDTNPRATRQAANDRQPTGPSGDSETNTSSSATWPALIAAGLVILAAAGWYFLRGRKARAG